MIAPFVAAGIVIGGLFGLGSSYAHSEAASRQRRQIKAQISKIEGMKREIEIVTREKERKLNQDAERQRIYYGQYVTQDSATIGEVNTELGKTLDYVHQLSQNQINIANNEISNLQSAYEDADYGAFDFFSDFLGGAASFGLSALQSTLNPVNLKKTMPNLAGLTMKGIETVKSIAPPPRRPSGNNDYMSSIFNSQNPALLEARGGMLRDRSKKVKSLPVINIKKHQYTVED